MTTVNSTQTNPIQTSAAATPATGAAASAATSRGGAEIGKTRDQFLTMLVTQMKNQDPMNPMDNGALTSQLAQISTAQGMMDLNTTLQSLLGQANATQSLEASALIGKSVLVTGGGIKVGGGLSTESGIELISPAAKMTVTVSNASGHVVRTIESVNQPAGIVSSGWDARDDAGKAVPDGAYSISVKATDSSGAAVVANPLASGKVNSVAYTADGQRVDLGLTGTVAVSDIKKIM